MLTICILGNANNEHDATQFGGFSRDGTCPLRKTVRSWCDYIATCERWHGLDRTITRVIVSDDNGTRTIYKNS
jgi:hypothetical protein